jgi:hypothetical protein
MNFGILDKLGSICYSRDITPLAVRLRMPQGTYQPAAEPKGNFFGSIACQLQSLSMADSFCAGLAGSFLILILPSLRT